MVGLCNTGEILSNKSKIGLRYTSVFAKCANYFNLLWQRRNQLDGSQFLDRLLVCVDGVDPAIPTICPPLLWLKLLGKFGMIAKSRNSKI